MTSVLFVHDFPIKYEASTEKFYSNGFSYEIWKRYLNVFDKVKVASRLSRKNIKNDAQSSGPNVSFQPIKEYTSIKKLIINYSKISKNLENQIDKADCVIIRLPSVLGFVAANICIRKKKKYMVEVVGSMFDTYWNFGGLFAKALALPSEIIQKRSIKHASIAVYITQKYLQSKYPSKGEMFNGVSNVIVKDELLENNSFQDEINLNHPVKIGIVGSTYVRYKGHFIAVDTIKKLKEKGFTVQLQMVGQGLDEGLSKYIKEQGIDNEVIYKGMLNSEKEMDKWYQQLDMYIQPSKTEGHGRAVVEAISNRVPVFTSNVGGLPDSVNKEFQFSIKQPENLVDLLVKGIEDKKFLKQNIEENFKNIKKYRRTLVSNKRNEALNELKRIANEEVE